MSGLNTHVISCTTDPSIAPPLEGAHWVNTVSKQVWLSVGTDSISDWILVNQSDTLIIETINASSSSDVDTIPMTSLCAVKYIVCVSDAAQTKWKSFEMLGSKKTLTSIDDTIYSLLGDLSLDVDFDLVVSAGNAKLTVTNNEVFDINIKIHKNLL